MLRQDDGTGGKDIIGKYTAEEGKVRKRRRGVRITILSLLGVVLVFTAAAQVVLNSAFLTKTVNNMAARYVDGEIHFGRIHASAFMSFPNLKLDIYDFSITYPHERFAAYDSLWIANRLREAGRQENADTLAYFRKLSLSLDYPELLRGRFKFREISLDKARIFAHRMDSSANWKLFKTGKDSNGGATEVPHLIFKKLSLTGNPQIVYSSASDSLFASIKLGDAEMNGRLDIRKMKKARIHFRMDSVAVEGRTADDTLSFILDKFSIKDRKEVFDIRADADFMFYSNAVGEIDVPLDISTEVAFPENSYKTIDIKKIRAKAGTIDLNGNAGLEMGEDSSYVKAELLIDSCPLQETLRSFLAAAFPEVMKLETDAAVDLTLLCDGWYIPAKAALPELVAQISIPESSVNFTDFPEKGLIAADINASTDSYGKLNVSIDKLKAEMTGLSLDMSGTADDIMSDDPLISLDVRSHARLDTLGYLLPETIKVSGDIDAAVNGMILLSDMSPYNFSKADLEGYLRSDGIYFSDETDSISAFIGKTDIRLLKDGSGTSLGAELLSFKGTADSLYAAIGNTMSVRGKGLKLFMQNAESTVSNEFGTERHPIIGSIGANTLAMVSDDSLFVGVKGMSNRFRLSGAEEEGKHIPILALNSGAEGIAVRKDVNRAAVRNAAMNVSAIMRGTGQSRKRKNFLDSLQKVYPGIRRDSLIRHVLSTRELPDYLKEKEFRAHDIDIHVGESIAKYIRDWTISGNASISEGNVISPYFPLKNTIGNLSGSFDNDKVVLDSLTLRSGSSDISAAGHISGLQRALISRGILDLKLKITSERIDTDELIAAYNSGMSYSRPAEGKALDEHISDEQYMDEVLDTRKEASDTSLSLIVIPANIHADISLEGHGIKYSALLVDWFASDITMRQRTLQLTNTVASSNMGDIYLEGFYSTRTKEDISAGFDLNLVDITADKVVTLFPAVDSIMPMLKSFKGMLDCEMAATSKLDERMNLMTPTIKGVLSINGSDLSIVEDGGLKKLAKILMFKDRKVGRIKDMSVHGLISDNKLEIFPFVMEVDRYVLALDGTQHFDQNFKYHFSVLKSPLPFRFGINLYGNFDKWRYKVGKAKYKNADVPVFTAELDEMQVNLVKSIHNIFSKGAEIALQENAGGISSVDKAKDAAGYSADFDTGELDREEMEEYEKTLEEEEQESN